MAGLEVRNFDAPDETRAPDKTKVDIVRMGGTSASRMSLQPGWRWSECIQPIAGGDRCQLQRQQKATSRVAERDAEQLFGATQPLPQGDA